MSAGGFVTPSTPNLPDFLTFISNAPTGITPAILPANSPWPGYALDQAIALVLDPPCSPGILYVLAVYNCATHLLFAITPDQIGQVFFQNARSAKGYSLVQPSTGLVVSANDQGSGTTVATPKWAEGLTVSQLGFMRTPWGREYLAWAQSYGPTIVGLS